MCLPYLDPITGALRNRLGCAADQLAQAEADLSYAALAELDVRSLPGRYDLHHLQAFHRYIFREIYAWAGELRTVVIAKSAPFCLPQFIETAAELAADAGWRLDWGQLDARRNIAASAASMSGDLEPLTTMLDQLITPIG